MENTQVLEKRKFTWFLLFVGFCCVFGFVGMNAILLTKFTNARHFADPSAILGTLMMCLVSSSFYVVLGAVAFIWARGRLERTVHKEGLVCKSILPAVCLTPVLGIVGIMVMMLTPYAFAQARQFVVGPKVVQAADSPDGTYQAFVVDKPSFDGPNHHLYVKTPKTGRLDYVDNLPEDVDSNKEILWSPNCDVVVFRSHFKVTAYAPTLDKRQEVILGGERHSLGNGTFRVNYNDVKKVTDIQFPQPGVVTVQLEGEQTPQILTFEGTLSTNVNKPACCQRQ